MRMREIALRTALAVVIAGVVGTIVNAAALAIVLDAARLGLALVPGRHLVAIAVCAALPLLHSRLRAPWSWPAAVAWLALAPSLLAKLVFAAQAGWGQVLSFNLVFALAALFTYWLLAPRRAGERS